VSTGSAVWRECPTCGLPPDRHVALTEEEIFDTSDQGCGVQRCDKLSTDKYLVVVYPPAENPCDEEFMEEISSCHTDPCAKPSPDRRGLVAHTKAKLYLDHKIEKEISS
jgi:hypothetical protein